MNILIDTHCHTVASGHAHSTMEELAAVASAKGLKMIALTDHAASYPGGVNYYHILSQRIIPRIVQGVYILRGVEANILDEDGIIDVPDICFKYLDMVIGSFHDAVIDDMGVLHNTSAMINAITRGQIDVIGHLGNPSFPVDYEAVLRKALEYNVLVELNNSSLMGTRAGSRANCEKIAEIAANIGLPVVLSSDCHVSSDVGDVEESLKMAQDAGIPDENILNFFPDKFLYHLYHLRSRESVRALYDYYS